MTTAATPLARQLHDLLVREGYGAVHYDEEGDVVFTCDGYTYVALFDGGDARYLLLSLPMFWSLDDEEERSRALAACNRVRGTCKCAYVRVHGSSATAALELLMPPAGVLDGPYLRRLISMIRTAMREFEDLMQGRRRLDAVADDDGCIEDD